MHDKHAITWVFPWLASSRTGNVIESNYDKASLDQICIIQNIQAMVTEKRQYILIFG